MNRDYNSNPHWFYNAFLQQQQQRRQQQQIPPSYPSVSPYFTFHFPPPTLPTLPTSVQQTTFEEQRRYSKQRRLSFSHNYPNSYNVCEQPLELNREQQRLQDLRLTQYFGAPRDLEQYNEHMYHDRPLNKRKREDNYHDSHESQYQYESVLPFTAGSNIGNDVINHSDVSSVSSYETAPEEPIIDNDTLDTSAEQVKENNLLSNNSVKYLEHKENLKELIEKYGRSPGEIYVDEPIKNDKIKLPYESKKLFGDEVNRKAAAAMIEQFALSYICIVENKYNYTMKIQGSAEQVYLSRLMMDAILRDHARSNYFYVLLKLDGEHFQERAKKLYDTMSKIVPRPAFLTKTHDLHITVASFTITDDMDRKRMLKIVKNAGKELTKAAAHDHFTDYLNDIEFSNQFIAVVDYEEWGNNIRKIQSVIRHKLCSGGYINRTGSAARKMHMTLYRDRFSRTQYTKSRFLELLQAYETPVDFGRLFVSKIAVTENVVGLIPGERYRCDYIYDVKHPLEKSLPNKLNQNKSNE